VGRGKCSDGLWGGFLLGAWPVVIVEGVVVAGTGGRRELLCDDGTGRWEFGGGVVDVVVFSESE
jgi:hypothetical protein